MRGKWMAALLTAALVSSGRGGAPEAKEAIRIP